MSDVLNKEFMGFQGLKNGLTKEKTKTIYLEALYMGGRFKLQATNSFEVVETTGAPALKHIPTGKIYQHDKPFFAIMETRVVNVLAYGKSQIDVFVPSVLIDIEPIPSGVSPLPKMEEKKNK